MYSEVQCNVTLCVQCSRLLASASSSSVSTCSSWPGSLAEACSRSSSSTAGSSELCNSGIRNTREVQLTDLPLGVQQLLPLRLPVRHGQVGGLTGEASQHPGGGPGPEVGQAVEGEVRGGDLGEVPVDRASLHRRCPASLYQCGETCSHWTGVSPSSCGLLSSPLASGHSAVSRQALTCQQACAQRSLHTFPG